jgi:hypothetical protein
MPVQLYVCHGEQINENVSTNDFMIFLISFYVVILGHVDSLFLIMTSSRHTILHSIDCNNSPIFS